MYLDSLFSSLSHRMPKSIIIRVGLSLPDDGEKLEK